MRAEADRATELSPTRSEWGGAWGLAACGLVLFLLIRPDLISSELPLTWNSEEGAFSAFAQAGSLEGMPSLRYTPQQHMSVVVYWVMRGWYALCGDWLLATRFLGLLVSLVALGLWMRALWIAGHRISAGLLVWFWAMAPWEVVVQSVLVRGNHGNAALLAGLLLWGLVSWQRRGAGWTGAGLLAGVGSLGAVLNPALAPATLALDAMLVFLAPRRARGLAAVTAGALLGALPLVLVDAGATGEAARWLGSGGRRWAPLATLGKTLVIDLPRVLGAGWGLLCMVGLASLAATWRRPREAGTRALVGFCALHVAAWLGAVAFGGLALGDYGGYLQDRYALHVLPSLAVLVVLGLARATVAYVPGEPGERETAGMRRGIRLWGPAVVCGIFGGLVLFPGLGRVGQGSYEGLDLRASDPRAAGARAPWLAGWDDDDIRRFAARYPPEAELAFLVGAARAPGGLEVEVESAPPELAAAYLERRGQEDAAAGALRDLREGIGASEAYLRGVCLAPGKAGDLVALRGIAEQVEPARQGIVWEAAGLSMRPELAAQVPEEGRDDFHRGLGLGVRSFGGDLLREDLAMLREIEDERLRSIALAGARRALRAWHPTNPAMAVLADEP
jgi:hypothetical protein